MKQFNTWERYHDPKHPKHEYQVARHNWFMERIVGEKLLDVGCSGGLALYLAGKKDFVKELCGVDICRNTVLLARKRLECYTNKEVCLHVGRADVLPFESGYFDCVMCGETLEHVTDDKLAAAELGRVIKPGGVLLVSVPKEGHLSKEHVRLYTRKSLDDLIINAGFDLIEQSEMKASRRGYYLLIKAEKI